MILLCCFAQQLGNNLGEHLDLLLRGVLSKLQQAETLSIIQVRQLMGSESWFSSSSVLKRMYILRVCKRNGYSVSDLGYLFNCLIMSLFTYCIRVWGFATYTKYLSQIDRLVRRAFRFGYIQHESSIQQVIKDRDVRLWKSIMGASSHPLKVLLPPL